MDQQNPAEEEAATPHTFDVDATWQPAGGEVDGDVDGGAADAAPTVALS